MEIPPPLFRTNNSMEEEAPGNNETDCLPRKNLEADHNVNEYKYVGPNVIVMSDAGKPLFIRFGDEEQLTTLCGLIQAIRVSTLNDEHLHYGDIQCIKAADMKLVFMSAGALILVAIATTNPNHDGGINADNDDNDVNDDDYYYLETEAYLRMQLEYTYGQVLFALTNHVQTLLAINPSIDLRSMLGHTTDVTIRKALDWVGPCGVGCAPFLMSGIEVILGIPSEVRNATSKILSRACDANKDTIFAILSIGTKLFTMIQPSNPQHQLCHSDLSMLLNFVSSHNNTGSGGTARSSASPGMGMELWFPVCLPRLNPAGFVYAYHHSYRVDIDQTAIKPYGLNMTLVSQQSSTEQFALLQETASTIRRELGLGGGKEEDESILRIYDLRKPKEDRKYGRDEDVDLLWERTTASSIPTKFCNGKNGSMEKTMMMTGSSLQGSFEIYGKEDGEKRLPLYSSIIESVSAALKPGNYKKITGDYCKDASILHFIFCCNVPIRHYKTGKCTGGIFTQCLSTPIPILHPFDQTPKSKNRIWSIYQKLSLRLRLGSASVCATMNAFDRIMENDYNDTNGNSIHTTPTTTYFPASCLHETAPLSDRLVYVLDGEDIFVGMSGDGYQLYAVLPAPIRPADATQHCRRLLTALEKDRDTLFLANPLSF